MEDETMYSVTPKKDRTNLLAQASLRNLSHGNHAVEGSIEAT